MIRNHEIPDTLEEKIQEEIRKRVLERDQKIRHHIERNETHVANLEALKEITDVPREEIEQIAIEVRKEMLFPSKSSQESTLTPVSYSLVNIPGKFKKHIPYEVLQELKTMPKELQNEFWEEYEIQFRRIIHGYLTWVFYPFSVHYGILRKWFTQVLFWLTLGGLTFWWLADIFRIPQLVLEHNRKLARSLLKKCRKKLENTFYRRIPKKKLP